MVRDRIDQFSEAIGELRASNKAIAVSIRNIETLMNNHIEKEERSHLAFTSSLGDHNTRLLKTERDVQEIEERSQNSAKRIAAFMTLIVGGVVSVIVTIVGRYLPFGR